MLERIELLLSRLGQLGHQLRDTVARIIGTTVAEAVAEAIRGLTRLVAAPSGADNLVAAVEPDRPLRRRRPVWR